MQYKSQQDKTQFIDTQSARDNLLDKNNYLKLNKQINIEMRSVGNLDDNQMKYQVSRLMSIKRKTTSKVQTVKQKSAQNKTQQQIDNQQQKQLQLTKQKQQQGISDINYDIWDLTYTMMSSKIPIGLSLILFIIFIGIRYYTFACLIYITTQSHDKDILWILVIIGDRLLYMILVIKISLITPQTKTQIILKSHWNAKQSQISQLFQVVDTKKLIISIIRGIIPAQLAFIYIKAQPRKKFQLYTAINYINSSIQAVLYYPFFIAYSAVLSVDNTFGLNKYYQSATIAFAAFAQLIIIIVSIVLIGIGVKRKYGRLLFCWK